MTFTSKTNINLINNLRLYRCLDRVEVIEGDFDEQFFKSYDIELTFINLIGNNVNKHKL